MAPLFPRRSGARSVRLRTPRPRGATGGSVDAPGTDDVITEPVLGWIPASVGAALVSALATWILAAGVAVLGWLPGTTGSVGEALGFGSRMWLLGHLGGIRVGDAPWTLAPLGLTLIVVICLNRTATFAAHQALLGHLVRHGAQPMDAPTRLRTIARVAGLQTGVHLVVVLLVSVTSPGTFVGRVLLGTLVLGAVSTLTGAAAGVGARPIAALPVWARAVPRAVLAAQLVLISGAAVVLAVALIQQHERVTALAASTGAPATGTLTLVLLQLAYLPNLLLWSGSWTLAAGFTLGDGSIVAPVQTQLGLLPAIPVLGALPEEGPGSRAMLTWLVVGVVAGAVAAVTVMRARRRARFDETSLVGGLAGVLAGLTFVVLGWLSGGDLGSNRLTGLGPRFPDLLILAPTVLGISGMAVGLVWGLVRRPLRQQADDPSEEETVVLDSDDSTGGPDSTGRPVTKDGADDEPTVVLD